MSVRRPILPVGKCCPFYSTAFDTSLIFIYVFFLSLKCPILPLDSVAVTRHQTLISFSWQSVSFRSKVRTGCRGMMASGRVVAELRDQNPHYSDLFDLKSTWQWSTDHCVSHSPVFVIHTEPFPEIFSFIRCLFVRSLFPMPPVLMSKQQLMLFLQGWGGSAAPSAGRPQKCACTPHGPDTQLSH